MTTHNGPPRHAPVARWLVAAAVPAAALAALSSLPAGPASGAALEPALLTLGRVAGLALAGWLLATQLLYTAAVLTDTPRLAALLQPLTLPLLRRLAAGLATATLSLATPAALAQPTPAAVTAEHPELRHQATPTPSLHPLTDTAPEPAGTPPAVDLPAGSYDGPLTWLVRPGDHLWAIAGEHLAVVLDRPPSPDEHARYWAVLVDTAQPIIRSGDVDLIYPGERIPLPPLLDAGIRR